MGESDIDFAVGDRDVRKKGKRRYSVHKVTSELYAVSQKNSPNCFRQNFVKFPPTVIIFGTKMANTMKLCEVHSFSTSPNSCHHTTV